MATDNSNNDQTSVVKDHFGERSATYADMFTSAARNGTAYRFQRRSRIVGELAAAQNGSLIDCATGTGEVTLAALNTGTYTEACINDVSEEMLAKSQQLILESNTPCSCKFVTGDVFDLPRETKGELFDLVLCIGLVAHVGKLDELLGLCTRLLRPGGQILFQTTLLDHPSIKIIKCASEKRHIRQKGYAIRHYKHEEVQNACETLGLSIIQRRQFGIDIPFLDKFLPRLNYAIERQFESLCPDRGTEAIYVLEANIKTPDAVVSES